MKDQHICAHGYDKRFVHCNRCADPAFDAAKQPSFTVMTATIGGAQPAADTIAKPQGFPTSNVVAAEEAAFEVWFQQHRRETWTKSRPGERGPEPSAAWSMGLRPELRAGWMARAALQVETSAEAQRERLPDLRTFIYRCSQEIAATRTAAQVWVTTEDIDLLREISERLFFATLPKATPEQVAEARRQGKLPPETECSGELVRLRADNERLLHHVRKSPALSNEYVQLAETRITLLQGLLGEWFQRHGKARGGDGRLIHPSLDVDTASALRGALKASAPHIEKQEPLT